MLLFLGYVIYTPLYNSISQTFWTVKNVGQCSVEVALNSVGRYIRIWNDKEKMPSLGSTNLKPCLHTYIRQVFYMAKIQVENVQIKFRTHKEPTSIEAEVSTKTKNQLHKIFIGGVKNRYFFIINSLCWLRKSHVCHVQHVR